MARLLTLERQSQMGFDLIPYNCGGTVAFPQTDIEGAECAVASALASDSAYASMKISYATVQTVLNPYFKAVQAGSAAFVPNQNDGQWVSQIAASTSISADVVDAVLWETWNVAQQNPGSQTYQLWKGTASTSSGVFGNLFQGIGNALSGLGAIGTILPWIALGGGVLWVWSMLPKKGKL